MTELTARPWVGVHRYTYVNASGPKAVLFPVSDTIDINACAGANVTVDPTNQLVYGAMLYLTLCITVVQPLYG
jgi:hypothetical protein